MKYTPKQLIDYIYENGLEMSVFNAAMNNGAGYQIAVVNGTITFHDGKYFFLTDLGVNDPDAEKQEIEMENLSDDILVAAKAHPENLFAIIRIYGEEGNLFVSYSKNEAERQERSMRLMFDDFIRQLHIDTLGKLKKYISDGEEMVNKYVEFVNKYNITNPL